VLLTEFVIKKLKTGSGVATQKPPSLTSTSSRSNGTMPVALKLASILL